MIGNRSRLETQSGPSDEHGCDGNGGGEVAGELVVSRMDAAPILYPPDGPFDDVAGLVGTWVEGLDVLARWIVGNDGDRASGNHEAAQGIAVVGGIGGAAFGDRQRCQQVLGRPQIAHLPRREGEGENTARAIDDQVDLRAAPPA